MATESKIVYVSVQEEQRMIDIYQCFGWELANSQEITNNAKTLSTSYMDANGKDITVVSTDYVRLHFVRERKMPCYNDLVNLEQQYWAVKVVIGKFKHALDVIAVLLVVASLALLLFIPDTLLRVLCPVIVCIVALLLFVIQGKKNKKIKKANDNALSVAEEKRLSLATQGRTLVDGKNIIY